jgi:hypothetical protein
MKRLDPEKMIEYLEKYYVVAHQELLIAAVKACIVDEAEKVDPDPIIEVWEKYKDRFTGDWSGRFATEIENDISQAITKYAEGKGKK